MTKLFNNEILSKEECTELLHMVIIEIHFNTDIMEYENVLPTDKKEKFDKLINIYQKLNKTSSEGIGICSKNPKK